MTKTVALFHSVLGVREGINLAADHLRAAGHTVHVIDQYDGRVFDDYDEATEFVQTIGFPALMQRALEGVEAMADGFAAMGFSNGGGMATFVACNGPVERVILCSGALPVHRIGIEDWPARVPAQLHYAVDDPFKTEGSVQSVLDSVNAAGAVAEYIQYPGAGHLFTDPSLPAEYDAGSAETLWQHALRFLNA
ncbi:MAG: dienelactone hydrolase family protein [Solirubrobacterales bacterium]|nr:dienelactone hydrolase family protein [Solirubrobacterales bacterium]